MQGESTEYFVDPQSIEEMTRLLSQGRLLTEALGLLATRGNSFEGINTVLDIACGPGEWVHAVAKENPSIQVKGIDISQTMTNYARAQAYNARLKNLVFEVVDATKLPLAIPDSSFDLVNARLISAFMTRSLWPLLIREAYRITAPSGHLRIIQEDLRNNTNSPAVARYNRLANQALYKAGKGFEPDYMAVIPRLRNWFADAGYKDVQQRHTTFDLDYGTHGHDIAIADYKAILPAFHPFLVKYGICSMEEANSLYQQFLQETDFVTRPDGSKEPFVCFWHISSVIGQKI